MLFKSTRSDETVISTKALVNGIAEDGGLYFPTEIPKVDLGEISKYDYVTLAKTILAKFLDLEESYLEDSIIKAYSSFDNKDIAPVVSFDNYGFIELFHGKTLAFKDFALSLLPYLVTGGLKSEKINSKVTILTATSGDTGSAAISGFQNIDNIKICVLYPKKGISEIQRRQMTTVKADNVMVFGINGNFDDAQRSVKSIFGSDTTRKIVEEEGYILSSANSINIGRLLPQVVYYFSSYFQLVKQEKIKLGDFINVVVPTGNFGNIMASYIAKEMGLPIEHFICASNDNNILTDFLNTGIYDTKRDFIITTSPSMDILVSSNLERLIYKKCGTDITKKAMEDLKNTGKFTIDISNFNEFYGGFATEKEVEDEINNIYKKDNYIIDPHTAVASVVYKKFVKDTESTNFTLMAATASPYKFPKTICKALNIDVSDDDFQMVESIVNLTKDSKNKMIEEIQKSEEIFDQVIDVDTIEKSIIEFIKKG